MICMITVKATLKTLPAPECLPLPSFVYSEEMFA